MKRTLSHLLESHSLQLCNTQTIQRSSFHLLCSHRFDVFVPAVPRAVPSYTGDHSNCEIEQTVIASCGTLPPVSAPRNGFGTNRQSPDKRIPTHKSTEALAVKTKSEQITCFSALRGVGWGGVSAQKKTSIQSLRRTNVKMFLREHIVTGKTRRRQTPAVPSSQSLEAHSF